MKKRFLVLAFAFALTAAVPDPGLFTGEILYKYSFEDLEGKDITAIKGAELGLAQRYLVSDSSYKSYNENGDIIQLYQARTNMYYGFWKDKTSLQIDALNRSSQQYTVTHLNKNEKILGYDCRAIEVVTDNTSTVYYYSPEFRINSKGFEKHNFGDFNAYLKATDGALALKYIITYPKEGFRWTIIAEKIVKKKLNTEDFQYPSNYRLKN